MNIKVNLKFKGVGFSPKRFGELIQLPIRSIIESGDKLAYGPNRGKPSSYGHGILTIQSSSDADERVNEYLEVLTKHQKQFKEYHLEKITIDIQSSLAEETSFELGSDAISKLSQLNAGVIYSTYETDIKEQESNSHIPVRLSRESDNSSYGIFHADVNPQTQEAYVGRADIQNFLTYIDNINPNYTAASKLASLITYYNKSSHSSNLMGRLILEEVRKLPEIAALGVMTGYLFADTGATASISSRRKHDERQKFENAVDLSKLFKSE